MFTKEYNAHRQVENIFKSGKIKVDSIFNEFNNYMINEQNLNVIYSTYRSDSFASALSLFIKTSNEIMNAGVSLADSNWSSLYPKTDEVINKFVELLQANKMKHQITLKIQLFLYSFEELAKAYAIYHSKERLEKEILTSNKLFRLYRSSEPPRHNFFYRTDKELIQNSNNGTNDKIREKSFEIVKKYDKFNYLNNDNYVANFYSYESEQNIYGFARED